MAEEWVKVTRNEVRLTDNLHVQTNKALGAAEQKNKELNTKLAAEERGRRSVEVGFKNAQDQVEE